MQQVAANKIYHEYSSCIKFHLFQRVLPQPRLMPSRRLNYNSTFFFLIMRMCVRWISLWEKDDGSDKKGEEFCVNACVESLSFIRRCCTATIFFSLEGQQLLHHRLLQLYYLASAVTPVFLLFFLSLSLQKFYYQFNPIRKDTSHFFHPSHSNELISRYPFARWISVVHGTWHAWLLGPTPFERRDGGVEEEGKVEACAVG